MAYEKKKEVWKKEVQFLEEHNMGYCFLGYYQHHRYPYKICNEYQQKQDSWIILAWTSSVEF